MQTLKCIL